MNLTHFSLCSGFFLHHLQPFVGCHQRRGSRWRAWCWGTCQTWSSEASTTRSTRWCYSLGSNNRGWEIGLVTGCQGCHACWFASTSWGRTTTFLINTFKNCIRRLDIQFTGRSSGRFDSGNTRRLGRFWDGRRWCLHCRRHFFDCFGTIRTIPHESGICRFFVGNHWNVTFLMIQILTSVTFHKFVAIFLVKRLANVTCAIIKSL